MCLHHCRHCFYKLFLFGLFLSTILPKVFMSSICSSTSVVLGLNDNMCHDCNCSLFVLPHGLYLCTNIIFSIVRSLNFDLFVWNQTNAGLSNVCSKRSIASLTRNARNAVLMWLVLCHQIDSAS